MDITNPFHSRSRQKRSRTYEHLRPWDHPRKLPRSAMLIILYHGWDISIPPRFGMLRVSRRTGLRIRIEHIVQFEQRGPPARARFCHSMGCWTTPCSFPLSEESLVKLNVVYSFAPSAQPFFPHSRSAEVDGVQQNAISLPLLMI
jgi:hypothetical protein